MKKLGLLLFTFCIIFASCSKDESTMEEESARLDKMYEDIILYSQINIKTCTNPDEWALLKLGESLCSGYIIYNKSINIAVFQKKISKYQEAKGKFDIKWGIFYDCMTMPVPTGISCVEGKATIIYPITTHQ